MFRLIKTIFMLNIKEYLMFIGPCIIVIVEEYKINLLFYFTSYVLNMFRILI
jgi:hypothetical protein